MGDGRFLHGSLKQKNRLSLCDRRFLNTKTSPPVNVEWRISGSPEFRDLTYQSAAEIVTSTYASREEQHVAGVAGCSFSHFLLRGRACFVFYDFGNMNSSRMESLKGTWTLIPIRIKFLSAQRIAGDLGPRPRSCCFHGYSSKKCDLYH